MTFITNLNLGDIAFYMEDNKVISSEIVNIRIDINSSQQYIQYATKDRAYINEEQTFKSKQDLLDSL